MSKFEKVLITGASGFLGYNLARSIQHEYEVIACYHKYPVLIDNVTACRTDLSDSNQVSQTIQKFRPDIIFHLAAMSTPSLCEKNPLLSYEINVCATRFLVEAAQEINAQLVFTSSDLVFDGENAPYRESDPPNPVNRYGRQKAEAEQVVMNYKNGTVCRMPLMFGDKAPNSGSFIQPMIQFLRANQKLNLFEDEIRTPLSAAKAVEGLMLIAERNPRLVHLSGNQSINRYDFGVLLCSLLDINTDLLRKRKLEDFSFEASRPANTSMDNTLARSMGFHPGELTQELEAIIKK